MNAPDTDKGLTLPGIQGRSFDLTPCMHRGSVPVKLVKHRPSGLHQDALAFEEFVALVVDRDVGMTLEEDHQLECGLTMRAEGPAGLVDRANKGVVLVAAEDGLNRFLSGGCLAWWRRGHGLERWRAASELSIEICFPPPPAFLVRRYRARVPAREMNEDLKITWYRTPVDKEVMRRLMQRSDGRALMHCLSILGLSVLTGAVTYAVFLQITATNWMWTVPLLLFCLFWHGSFLPFMGGVAGHELAHKTPFRNQKLNDVFLTIFSFLSWFDPIGFRLSHVKHHQVTTFHERDGEVILPQKLDWGPLEDGEVVFPTKLDRKLFAFLMSNFLPFPNPLAVWRRLVLWTKYATGNLEGLGFFAGGAWWLNTVLPESKTDERRRHRNWARVVLLGHLALAAVFVATGHWFLVVLVTCSSSYAGWLGSVCGLPQHIGMGPDVPDFRLCCRTYTCGWFPALIYWNMQYHIEHHMFPAVPFYNLPALRKAIEWDLPPAPHGLWATWREIVPILKKQNHNPACHFVPELPVAAAVR